MGLTVEVEEEVDGRWLAGVPQLPGVLAYGATRLDAVAHAQALALRVIADRLEHGEPVPELGQMFAVPVFAFHDNDEIGPRMLARISKHTGLRPDDL